MKTITDYIVRHAMFTPGMKVLCAVSGGADSMCLLHYLFSNREVFGIEVVAAHYEHGIRGEEALRDCEFVASFCKAYGIEFLCEHGDVPAYAKAHSISIELAARKMRYEFLRRAAKSKGADRIATAHNKNDNAETVLLNLTRGTGMMGLCGIPPVRGSLIRPLLATTRSEILCYNEANHIPFVEDSTNASDEYTRNILRHHVLPVLQKINPEVEDAIYRTSQLLREDELHLRWETESFLALHCEEDSVPCEALRQMDRAVQTRTIRALCSENLQVKHVDAILSLMDKPGLCYCDVPGVRVRKEQGKLYFSPAYVKTFGEYELPKGGEVLIQALGMKVHTEFLSFNGEVHDLFNTFYVNCGEIYGRLYLTPPYSGDCLRILGRDCSKSLKKMFTENRVTQKRRRETIVLRDDIGVLAVRGFALAERTKPVCGEKTLKICFEKVDV